MATKAATTFETSLGCFQLIGLPQGATNLVVVYQAQMLRNLHEEIPTHIGVFIDNGGIMGPFSQHNNEALAEKTGI